MLDNAMLDVAIGLVFLFLVLSLICTTINEAISSLLKLRARTLRQALNGLLDEPTFRTAFFNTPFMRAISGASGEAGPSYIPARTFVASILDAAKTHANAAPSSDVNEIRSTFAALPDSNMKDVLINLAESAKHDVADLKNQVAAWFDDMMDRAAGRFKRKMGVVTMICAFSITIAFNADSIAIANALWADESMRSQLAEAAETFVAEAEYVEDLAEFGEVEDVLRPMPLGWKFGDPAFVTDWYKSFGGILLKIVGLVFTGLAVSLGAPFWFDVLQKFIKIRNAGPKPKSSESKTSEAATGGS